MLDNFTDYIIITKSNICNLKITEYEELFN